MSDVDKLLVQLLERDSFRPGDRLIAYPEWSTASMSIVESVDVEAGTITLRSPTRWERFRYRVSYPWRWLRWRFAR